ncbi:MAG: helix-turn-helix transcriptional regulator [Mogibacterium sp.]|nr:helix-turn-helix transcriptional regulator [Mogibacterium sp.]
MRDSKDMTYEEILECPIYKTMEIFQGKWNAWVLFELGRNETIRFGELQRAIPGLSKTVLSSTLKDLEERGLVNRVQYNEIPPHVEYSATESAKDLKDIFAAMWDGGEKHIKTR